jgi:hypothetical protein
MEALAALRLSIYTVAVMKEYEDGGEMGQRKVPLSLSLYAKAMT